MKLFIRLAHRLGESWSGPSLDLSWLPLEVMDLNEWSD